MDLLNKHKKTQSILKKFISACRYLLNHDKVGKQAKEYLNDRINKNIQKTFGFGYFPEDQKLDLLTSIISKEELEFIGMCYPKFISGNPINHGHFSDHNLIMPFTNVHGDIVSLVGRTLLSDDERGDLQKYKYNVGCKKEKYVYGLNFSKDSIIKKDYVICVEGQFDCLSLFSEGIHNAIAVGCAELSKYQMFQILRYTKNIFIMFDNDEAGSKGKQKAKDQFGKYANIKTIDSPKEFKDIDEFFRKTTDSEYKSYVVESLNNMYGA
jgi:DNA primase